MFSIGKAGRGGLASAKFFADGRVQRATREEGDGDADENEIVHSPNDTVSRVVRLIKNRQKPVKKTLRPAFRLLLATQKRPFFRAGFSFNTTLFQDIPHLFESNPVRRIFGRKPRSAAVHVRPGEVLDKRVTHDIRSTRWARNKSIETGPHIVAGLIRTPDDERIWQRLVANAQFIARQTRYLSAITRLRQGFSGT